MDEGSPAGRGGGWPYEPALATDPTREDLEQRTMACKLPAGDIKERIERLRAEFIPGILHVQEIEDGYVYWFQRSDEELRKVAEFARFESECCDFLDFGIGLNTGALEGAACSIRDCSGGRERSGSDRNGRHTVRVEPRDDHGGVQHRASTCTTGTSLGPRPTLRTTS
jgi:hypothetical protein